jgi:hypothetical protein
MPRPLPLYLAVGDVVGLFTIVEGPCQRGQARRTMVRVACQVCGREKWLPVGNVEGASCICARESHQYARRGAKHPLYWVWANLKQRCSNPNHPEYRNYGGRGIKVCDQWRDAASFLVWAGSAGWEPGLQIDRIDNDGDYEPDNCRFVTAKVNANNRRFSGRQARGGQ